MPDDIVTRLRLRPTILRKNRFGDMETDRAATALFDDCHAIMRDAADEIERLHRDYSCICNEMRRMMDERDEASLQTRRILNEIDCRIEHGAESNGHLEAIRNLFTEATDDRGN